jgi:hypothetical protein
MTTETSWSLVNSGIGKLRNVYCEVGGAEIRSSILIHRSMHNAQELSYLYDWKLGTSKYFESLSRSRHTDRVSLCLHEQHHDDELG